ncbi:MAG: glycosyltransferase family 87 protein [Acidobacteria bacterium]|nr:glycosyltransferase family 87 protein [Acidobacteriota bacterium]
MPPRSLLFRNLGILASATLLALFGVVTFDYLRASEGLIDASGHVVGWDFMVFHSSGVLAEQGRLADLFDQDRFHASTEELFAHELPLKPRIWPYPPPMLLVTVPFGRLPYLWSLTAWSAIFLAAYLMATRRIVLLAAPATMANLLFGQTGFLVGALFFWAFRVLRHRPVLAGMLLGMVVVKPHLGLMVPLALLAARAWRAFLGAALTLGALALLSGLMFGWDAWRLWIQEVLSHQVSVLHMGEGGDILLSVWQGATYLGAPAGVAWAVQGLGTTTAVVATWWAFSRLRRGSIAPARAFSILVLATCMATPYIFNYDWTLLAPVAVYGLAWWRRKDWTRTGMGLADVAECSLWLAIWMLPVLWLLPYPLAPSLAAVAVPAALALMVRGAAREGGKPMPASCAG